MAFTEAVEKEIRELEEEATFLGEQIQYLAGTIAGLERYAEPLRVNRLLSDSRYNDWRDVQDAIDHLRTHKERLKCRRIKIYGRIDLYEYELSR